MLCRQTMSKPRLYVVVNDLIGGYDLSPYNKPASQHGPDEYPVAWGLSEEWATLLVYAWNTRNETDDE